MGLYGTEKTVLTQWLLPFRGKVFFIFPKKRANTRRPDGTQTDQIGPQRPETCRNVPDLANSCRNVPDLANSCRIGPKRKRS